MTQFQGVTNGDMTHFPQIIQADVPQYLKVNKHDMSQLQQATPSDMTHFQKKTSNDDLTQIHTSNDGNYTEAGIDGRLNNISDKSGCNNEMMTAGHVTGDTDSTSIVRVTKKVDQMTQTWDLTSRENSILQDHESEQGVKDTSVTLALCDNSETNVNPDDETSTATTHVDNLPLQRFRKAVKTIITLMRATSTSRGGNQQQAENNNLLSFYQYQQEILDSEGAACQSDLTFDPHHFRARRETTLSSEVKAILCMEPGRRSIEQRHLALSGLQLAVSAFSEFPIRMQESLVRVGWYENFGAKRMIIRQGHFADNFYLILSGTAVVTILETDKETGEPRVRTAAFLGRGNSFGELALMHGAKRSATVTCKDNVELLAVGREDFIAIFMSVPKDREPDHIRFLRKLDILQGWPFEKIPWSDPKICLLTYFRRGVVMCRDINKSEWIYVIKTGSCRALACLQATSPSVTGLLYQQYAASMTRSKHKTLLSSANNRSMLSSRSETSTDLLNTLSSNRHDRRNKLIIYTKPLPPIEPVQGFHERHKAVLEKIYNEKHVSKQEDTTGNPPESDTKQQDRHRVFLQLQLLSPKDTFGLQPVSCLDDCARISLVSDGAEAVLISRRFFVHHLSYDMRKHLASTVQPYPTQHSLQQKFEDQKNWDDFKVMTVSDHVNYTKYIHETLEV